MARARNPEQPALPPNPVDDGKEAVILLSQLARMFRISLQHASRMATEGTFERVPGGLPGQFLLYKSAGNYAERLQKAAFRAGLKLGQRSRARPGAPPAV
jgi:hypothetical protein